MRNISALVLFSFWISCVFALDPQLWRRERKQQIPSTPRTSTSHTINGDEFAGPPRVLIIGFGPR